jgi:GntR family histidine utilization transcriptional repressor
MSGNSYQEIRNAIFARITAGDWPPGAFIPGEADLAAEYGCARATVNRALQALADDGVVERRRRAGTRVKELPSRRASFDIPIIRQQIELAGVYGYHLLNSQITRAPDHIIATLRVSDDAELFHIEALHLMDHRPYIYEDRWVNTIATPGILSAPLKTISANEWLLRETPYSDAALSFAAVAANKRQAEALDAAEGDPLFTLDRTTWLEETYITTVTLYHRPGYSLKANI